MIDLHAHYVSPALAAQAKNRRFGVDYEEEDRIFIFPSGPSRPVRQQLTDLKTRRDWIAERSIEIQVVSPWMDIAGDDLEESSAKEWCGLYNDTTAMDLGDFPAFKAFAALPMSSGRAASEELRRCVEEHRFVGGAIPTQVKGLDLDVVGVEKLFETAETLGVPLFIHPFRVMAHDRMGQHFLSNICGNPYETTIAALRLFFWGVFDRWPGLKLLLAHAGGALPILAGRAWHASNHASGFDRPLESPSEILDCFYYDTLLHDPSVLSHVIRTVGSSRMVAGTDSPFPMRLDDPVGHVRAAADLADLDEGNVDQILSATARGLLRI